MKKNDLEFLWNLRTKGLSEETKSRLLKGTGNNGAIVNRDYIYALAIVVGFQNSNPTFKFDETISAKDIWLGIPKHERMRLSFYSPCLALNYDELKQCEQSAIFDNNKWVFTKKYTGIRCIIVCMEGQFKLYSRNYSDDDCHCIEYTSKISQDVTIPKDVTFVVDTEMVLCDEININDDLATHGVYAKNKIESLIGLLSLEIKDSLWIQKNVKQKFGIDLIEFRLITPIYYNNVNYLNKHLGDGMNVYDSCIEYGKRMGINIKPIDRCVGNKYEKMIFLNTILNEGGEGVVAQNINGTYNTTDKRSKDSYVKIKHSIGEVRNGLYDTIDGWIGGYKVGSNGMINALNVFTNVDINGKHCPFIVAVIPLNPKMQKQVTIEGYDGYSPSFVEKTDRIVSLNYEYYNKVVELDGNGINGNRRIISPTIVRFRDDKSKNECVYTKDFFISQIKEKSDYKKM